MVMHVRGSNWRFTSKLTFSQERHCDCLYQNYTAFLQNVHSHILGLSNEAFFVFVAFFVLAQSQSEFKKPKIFDWNFGKIAWWRGSKKIDLPMTHDNSWSINYHCVHLVQNGGLFSILAFNRTYPLTLKLNS